MKTMWVGDLESDGLLAEATVIHCAVFKELESDRVVAFTPDNIQLLPTFLEQNVEELIIHNGIQFDIPLIKKVLGYEFDGKVYDTLVLSRMLSPNRRVPRLCPNTSASPHGLESWGWRVGRGKPEHNDWSTYSEAMLHRCTEDVYINELVYHKLQDEMVDGDWSRAVPMSMKLFQVFNEIEENGWKVDIPLINTYIEQLSAMQEDLLEEAAPQLPYIIEDLGVVNKPFTKAGAYNATLVKWYESRGQEMPNVAAPYTRVNLRIVDLHKRNEVVELLLAEGWIPEQWNVNKETQERTSPKLSKTDPFEGIAGSVGKVAARFIQVRHRKSLLEGLLKLVRVDGRIGSRITGLAETSRVKHAGIVNIPNPDSFFGEEIRKIFIAEEGKVLVGVDSAGNQVRQLCALMGDDAYEYEVLHGDVHESNRDAAGLPTRGAAKTFFYGFLFGAGDAKTGRIINGTAADGKAIKQRFLAGLPKLGELVDRLKSEWRGHASRRINKWGRMEYYNGWVSGLDGRPVYIKSEHAILVYVLQNMEAIQMSYALLFAHKWLAEGLTKGEDYDIVCFYHDEINIECRPEVAQEVGEIVKRAIVYAGVHLGIKTPHDGDIKIGNNWYDIH